MAVSTKLIQANEVIELAVVNKLLDSAFIIDNNILFSQRKYIRPKLGDDLYDQILLEVDTKNNTAITAVNKTLIEDYIKFALAFLSLYEALPDIHIRLGDQGLRQSLDDFSTEVSNQDFAMFRSDKKIKGEQYLFEMINFLKDNKADYPLFDQCDTDRPRSNNFIIY